MNRVQGTKFLEPTRRVQCGVWIYSTLNERVINKMKCKPRSALAEPCTCEITLYAREMRWFLNPEYLTLRG